jgi:hypothetical protein
LEALNSSVYRKYPSMLQAKELQKKDKKNFRHIMTARTHKLLSPIRFLHLKQNNINTFFVRVCFIFPEAINLIH